MKYKVFTNTNKIKQEMSKKSLFFYMMAAMLIFATACSKDDENEEEDPGTGTNGPTFTGVNTVNFNNNGTTKEFIFADEPVAGTGYSAFGTRQTEEGTVYSEIMIGANDHFDQVSTAALIINYLGDATGMNDISYGIGEENNLYNFTGSNFILLTDTAMMPTMYTLEEATANITSYGDVGGYIEGTFESSAVSLVGVPQPNVTISGNFKVVRYEGKK